MQQQQQSSDMTTTSPSPLPSRKVRFGVRGENNNNNNNTDDDFSGDCVVSSVRFFDPLEGGRLSRADRIAQFYSPSDLHDMSKSARRVAEEIRKRPASACKHYQQHMYDHTESDDVRGLECSDRTSRRNRTHRIGNVVLSVLNEQSWQRQEYGSIQHDRLATMYSNLSKTCQRNACTRAQLCARAAAANVANVANVAVSMESLSLSVLNRDDQSVLSDDSLGSASTCTTQSSSSVESRSWDDGVTTTKTSKSKKQATKTKTKTKTTKKMINSMASNNSNSKRSSKERRAKNKSKKTTTTTTATRRTSLRLRKFARFVR